VLGLLAAAGFSRGRLCGNRTRNQESVKP